MRMVNVRQPVFFFRQWFNFVWIGQDGEVGWGYFKSKLTKIYHLFVQLQTLYGLFVCCEVINKSTPPIMDGVIRFLDR